MQTRADHSPVGTGKLCRQCKLPRDKHRPSHNPLGDPCAECGLPAAVHRVKHIPYRIGPAGEHIPTDGECACGVSMGNHRVREMAPSDRRRHNARTYAERQYFVGVDGEGQGDRDHKYVMLAASDASGTKRWHVEVPAGRSAAPVEWKDRQGKVHRHHEGEASRGLSTVECLEFLLNLPNNAHAFSYGFNYDITKILADVDNETLYLLFRPEMRTRKPFWKKGKRVQPLPAPVTWNGYGLNLVGSCFTVVGRKEKGGQQPRERVVWDIFKFFQGSFVNALVDWKVGEADVLERMRFMKEKRREFDTLPRDEIRRYCLEECAYLADLADKLTVAHEAAGLHLKRYYGAGSTAAAILDRMEIKEQKRTADPPEMQEPIAAAFFGGRFENSVAGPVKGPIYNYDLSSAYPYQLYFLPCLACGTWRHTTKREDIDSARAALVHYKLGTPPPGITWGPFPFRMKDGTIAFPATSGGGWVWQDEYRAGERLFPHVQFVEAWVYDCACSHRPFEEIPKFYLERLKLGKEGAGIVLKLGPNSCYGKLAQSVGGEPPYQSWVWAGMITSGTRAQILDLIGLHKDRANVLMIATDGVASRELIDTPRPRDTGTFSARDWTDGDWAPKDKKHPPAGNPCTVCGQAESKHGKLKPLGGWELKVYEKGIFLARPGIYFPLDPTPDEMKLVRARGIGRKYMYDGWREIVRAWEEGNETVDVANVPRFWGAKSSISQTRQAKETVAPEEIMSLAEKWARGFVRATTRPGVAIKGDPRVVEGVVGNITTSSITVAGIEMKVGSVQSFEIAADDPQPGQFVRTATADGGSVLWRVISPTEIGGLLAPFYRPGQQRPRVLVVIDDGKATPTVLHGSLLSISREEMRVAHSATGATTARFDHIRLLATEEENSDDTEALLLLEQLPLENVAAGLRTARTRSFEIDRRHAGRWTTDVAYRRSVPLRQIWPGRRHWALRHARVVLKQPLPGYREHIDGTFEVRDGKPVIAHVPHPRSETAYVPIDHRFEQVTLFGDVIALRSGAYGQWRNQTIVLAFDPMPKRDRINPDNTLAIRSFAQTFESMPYKAAIVSPEAAALKLAAQQQYEQPDPGSRVDFEDNEGTDYEGGDDGE